MTSSRDKKIFITISISTTVILAFLWFVFFFQGGRIKKSAEAYQKEKLNYYVLQEKKNKLLQLKKDMSDLEIQKERLETAFVKKDELVPIIRLLEKAAEDSSCAISIEPADLNKLKFEQTKKTQKKEVEAEEEDSAKKKDQAEESKKDELAALKNYPVFNISVSGSFPSLIDFLEKMENLPYFIRPLIIDAKEEDKKNNPSLSAAGASSAGGKKEETPPEDIKRVEMNITIVIYGEQEPEKK